MARSDRQEPADVPSRGVRGLKSGLATALTLLAVAWSGDLFREAGLLFYTGQFLMAVLGLALPLIYLHFPARGESRERVPFYDWIAAFLGFGFGAFAAVSFPRLSEELTYRPVEGVVTGIVLILLIIEALRRTTGPVLVVVVLAFIAYGMLGDMIPGVLEGRPSGPRKLAYYLSWDVGAILGTPLEIAATVVVAFVLFGNLLQKSGGSEVFTDISVALMGRYRGGSAKIAVTASALFGSISGSAVSNVVSTGVITIPMMRKGGYPAHVAGAIEAVASTGGQLMPPIMGAAAFLMAEILQVSYAEVVLAALAPALLYYVAVFIQVDLEAAKRGIASVERANIPSIWPVLKHGWIFVMPFVVLIYALFELNLTPQTAALWAAGTVIALSVVIGYRGLRIGPRGIFEVVRQTGYAICDIVMITAAAGIIIGVLSITGLGFGLTLALVQVAGGNLYLLLVLAAIVCIVLGLGMPTLGVYLLLATLVAPALVELGVEPMAAHLFVMYFGMMSMITPPVAIAAFAAANVAGADAMRTGFAAVRFGWTAYIIPFLFVLSPTLLLAGTPLGIAIACLTAVGGVWLISAAVTGYFGRPMGAAERAAFAVAGLMMLTPADLVPGGLYIDLAGFVAGAALMLRGCAAGRTARRKTGQPA